MEEKEIISLWQSYNKKLEDSLMLNKKNAEDITGMKVRSLLASMQPLKIFAILAGVGWVGFVDVLIVNLFRVASPFFLVSAGIQSVLTTLAIGIYLYQLILINQTDIGEPVLATQERIARLKSSTLWAARLLFLQLPVWTTFYINQNMLKHGNDWLYAVQIIVTTAFTYAAAWLFFNIRYENRNKKWFRLILKGKEWDPVMKSMELLEEINEYRKI